MNDNQKPFFMNRVSERDDFKSILTWKNYKRVLLYLTEEGEGKTTLLHHLYQQCQEEQILSAWIDFDSGHEKIQYHKFLYRIIDELGSSMIQDHFIHTYAQIEQNPSSSLHLNGLPNPTLNGHNIGPNGHSSHDNAISQNPLHFTTNIFYNGTISESAESKERTKDMTGRAFRSDLTNICNQHPVVLFFDAFENTSKETRSWIEEWIFDSLYKCPQLVIVIAGTPDLSSYFTHSKSWKPLVKRNRNMLLSTPTKEDILKYMAYHNIDTDHLHLLHQAALLNMAMLDEVTETLKTVKKMENNR